MIQPLNTTKIKAHEHSSPTGSRDRLAINSMSPSPPVPIGRRGDFQGLKCPISQVKRLLKPSKPVVIRTQKIETP